MKKINRLVFRMTLYLLICGMIMAVGSTALAQKYPMAVQATNLADSSHWVFTANQAQPLTGGSKYLSSGYTVSYNANKLIVYLPYYGRADATADVLSGRSPLDFVTVAFTMEEKTGKKGRHDIIIKPTDNREVRSLNFSFYNNDNARLDVTFTGRSPISFSGVVEIGK